MTQILLVGCGKMGGAMLARWQVDPRIAITYVSPTRKTAYDKENTHWVAAPQELPAGYAPDIVVLAVKPQIMAGVLPAYARFQSSLFLSVAAGLTLDVLSRQLGCESTPFLRSMPNLPAQIGQGAIAVAANPFVAPAQKELATVLLSAVGSVRWLDKETDLDAITALSGSGPAYVFALVEAMEAAGLKLGLPADLCAQFARQTLIGSAALLSAHPDVSAGQFRAAVTSPNGTTQAALVKLLGAENGLFPLLEATMQSAAARASELALKAALKG